MVNNNSLLFQALMGTVVVVVDAVTILRQHLFNDVAVSLTNIQYHLRVCGCVCVIVFCQCVLCQPMSMVKSSASAANPITH